MDIDIAKDNLLDAKKILDRFGAPFQLAYGTLLGAYRDGQFIKWDKDIDIIIENRHNHLFRKSIRAGAWKEAGFTVMRDWDTLVSMSRKHVYIDIYMFHYLDAKNLHCKVVNEKGNCTANLKMPLDEFSKPSKIEFLGQEFLCPPPERYLKRVYGDWKTPKKGCHAPAFN